MTVRRPLIGVAVAGLLLVACGDQRPAAGMPVADGGSVDAPVMVIDAFPVAPDAIAGWERACLGWMLASCAKAQACSVINVDCGKTELELLAWCREKVTGRGGCRRPDPRSFESCQRQVAGETCDQYCKPGQQFCFEFCFFGCLDGQPVDAAVPDGRPDTAQVPEGTVTADHGGALLRLELMVHHLIVDRTRQRIYATVGSRSARAPNSLVVIDPATLAIERTLFVGSDPSVLAQSVDGSKLWLGLDGSQAIRSVALGGPQPEVGAQVPLPPYGGSRLRARSLVTLADGPDSVALTIDSTDTTALFGPMVFDAGQARGPVPRDWASRASQLLRGPDGWVFGYNDASTSYDFLSFTVGPTGLTQVAERRELLSGFETRIVFGAGRVYSSNGEVIDVANPAAPMAAGNLSHKGLLSLDVATHSAVVLSNDGEVLLRAIDTNSLTQTAAFKLGVLAEPAIWDFDRLNDDTFVFVAGEKRLATTTYYEGQAIYLVRNARRRFAGSN